MKTLAIVLLLYAALSPCTTVAGEPNNYSDCAGHRNPPKCIVSAVVVGGGYEPEEFLDAVIVTGAFEVVLPHRKVLVRGAKSRLAFDQKALAAFGITLSQSPPSSYEAANADDVLLASVALAAAATTRDDPFSDPFVKRLMGKVKQGPDVAYVAALLWNELDTDNEWTATLTRPRGLSGIWASIAAAPPSDNRLLLALAEKGEYSGKARAESLLLLRRLEMRQDVAPDFKARAASVLARRYRLADEAQQLLDSGGNAAENYDLDGIEVEIAEAALHGSYNEAAAHRVVEYAISKLHEAAYQSYLESAPLEALEAASARSELAFLGEAYLTKASEETAGPEDRGDWYALASDCYRRAGDRQSALDAARQGLPFVAEAVAARLNRGATARIQTIQESHQLQAVDANGFGTAPVLALYRAGAIREALQFGYLTGLDRFRNAMLAGEAPDPQWVVDDQSWNYLQIVTGELVAHKSVQLATDLRIKLRAATRAPNRLAKNRDYKVLALLAALTGHTVEMTSYLSREAAGDDPSTALTLAAHWQLADTVATRRVVD